jgi:hypothetical protein
MILLTDVMNFFKRFLLTIKVIGSVGIIFGAIYSTAQAWPFIEPYWWAHRGYVRYYDDMHVAKLVKQLTDVQLIQDDIKLVQNDERRQRLIDESAKREIELQGEQAKQLPQYRDLVQDRVNRIKQELKTLEEQDNSLFNEKKALGGK